MTSCRWVVAALLVTGCASAEDPCPRGGYVTRYRVEDSRPPFHASAPLVVETQVWACDPATVRPDTVRYTP